MASCWLSLSCKPCFSLLLSTSVNGVAPQGAPALRGGTLRPDKRVYLLVGQNSIRRAVGNQFARLTM